MTLQENLPSDKRQPGTYATHDDTSGSRGIPAVKRKLMIIAMKGATAPALANTPIQVFSEREARALFEEGTEAALGVEWGYRTWAKVVNARGGAGAEVWVTPVADPGGTAAVHAFTITGSANEAGTMAIFVAGRRVNVPINSGDANTAIATAAAAEIQKIKQNLPVTAAVGGAGNNEVRCTAVNTGTNGARILLAVDQQTVPDGVTVAITQDQTAGVGTASLVNALAATRPPDLRRRRQPGRVTRGPVPTPLRDEHDRVRRRAPRGQSKFPGGDDCTASGNRFREPGRGPHAPEPPPR